MPTSKTPKKELPIDRFRERVNDWIEKHDKYGEIDWLTKVRAEITKEGLERIANSFNHGPPTWAKEILRMYK